MQTTYRRSSSRAIKRRREFNLIELLPKECSYLGSQYFWDTSKEIEKESLLINPLLDKYSYESDIEITELKEFRELNKWIEENITRNMHIHNRTTQCVLLRIASTMFVRKTKLPIMIWTDFTARYWRARYRIEDIALKNMQLPF